MRVGVDLRAVALKIDLVAVDRAQSRSTKPLSSGRPRPGMDVFTPRASSASVNSANVNGQPWSVLKISDAPPPAIARAAACTPQAATSLWGSSHDRIAGLDQTMRALRSANPPTIGTNVMSVLQTGSGRVIARLCNRKGSQSRRPHRRCRTGRPSRCVDSGTALAPAARGVG